MKPRLLRGARRAVLALCGQLLVSLPASGAPSAAEKAAAESLFQEATELLEAGNYAVACGKFEASNAIDPGLGTKLWLADCYDRAGRTASAWALFTEAATLAQRASQPERERAATERANDLTKRLSRLELKLPVGGLPTGAQVTLDGVAIPDASLGSALPVDPGKHAVGVRAPGFRKLALETEVPAGPISVTLAVPALEREPERAKRPGSDALLATDATKRSKPGATQRTLSYALGGLGIASFAGAGILAYRAHQLDTDSRSECLSDEPNACSVDGAAMRDEARNYGNVATAAAIAGGVLTAAGIVLFVTAPSGSSERLRVGASFTPTSTSLVLSGRL